jgi:hypothetical protein
MLMGLLIAGFFSVACFKARAETPDLLGATPGTLFRLTDRLERLRRTRWQWCSIVLLLIMVRMERGTPLVAEVTALILFVVFLALPSQRIARREVAHRR